MNKITEKFDHIEKYYHCKLCPGQFGWIQEKDLESLEKHYKLFHSDGKRRTEKDFQMGD